MPIDEQRIGLRCRAATTSEVKRRRIVVSFVFHKVSLCHRHVAVFPRRAKSRGGSFLGRVRGEARRENVMSKCKQRSLWPVVFVVGAGIVGCSRAQPPPDAHSQPLVSSASIAPSAGLSAPLSNVAAASSTPATPSLGARGTDERWQRAAGEDQADKQALADALGAAGLVDALDDGGGITMTALACLPLADDADTALGPLAKRLLEATNESREPYLSALLGIAGRPARAREVVDPDGARQAGEAVLSMAKNEALPREHRALAISAARALAEKKIVDSTKIPTDLDPP
jgi:hypothetical protein